MRIIRLAPLAGLMGAATLATMALAQPAAPVLAFPLACRIGTNCEVQHYVDRDPGPGVKDYRCGHRTYEGHNGVDIRILDMAQQRAGVAVLAAAPGRVARLRDGVTDISIRAPGAPPVKGAECGNGVVIDHGDGWETQYCHLARGSVRVKIGDKVAAGAPIARVGLSGDTEFPHMHLTVRHGTQVVDPFDTDPSPSCGSGHGLWSPAAQHAMAYKAGAVLNAGFTAAPVTMDQVEAGGLPAFSPAAPFLVAYVRAIELELGDVIQLSLTGPGGAVLGASKLPPLDHDKAQYLAYVGGRRPTGGWARGTYIASFKVIRRGGVVMERRFQAAL
jgi:hypothetical protein